MNNLKLMPRSIAELEASCQCSHRTRWVVWSGSRLPIDGSVDSIIMTRNEVELHRAEKGTTALIIVSAITLNKAGDQPAAGGGQVLALVGWDIDEWTAVPLAYQLSRVIKSHVG